MGNGGRRDGNGAVNRQIRQGEPGPPAVSSSSSRTKLPLVSRRANNPVPPSACVEHSYSATRTEEYQRDTPVTTVGSGQVALRPPRAPRGLEAPSERVCSSRRARAIVQRDCRGSKKGSVRIPECLPPAPTSPSDARTATPRSSSQPRMHRSDANGRPRQSVVSLTRTNKLRETPRHASPSRAARRNAARPSHALSSAAQRSPRFPARPSSHRACDKAHLSLKHSDSASTMRSSGTDSSTAAT